MAKTTKKEVVKAAIKVTPAKKVLTKVAANAPGEAKNIIISNWTTTIPQKLGGIDASFELFNKFFAEIKTPVRFKFTNQYIIGFGSPAELVQVGKDLTASAEINKYQKIDFKIV